jgi:hypothetical protein
MARSGEVASALRPYLRGRIPDLEPEMIAVLRIAAVALVGCLPAGESALVERDPPPASAAVVVDWNFMANEVAFAEDQFLTFKGDRLGGRLHEYSLAV